MMKTILAVALAVAMTAAAQAAEPSEAQKADFYKTCMGIAQDATLCGCKADAAMTLIDAAFMDEVISGMKGKAPPKEDTVKYGNYIAQSNAKCIPGY